MKRRIQLVAFEHTRLTKHSPLVACPVCFSTEGLVTSAQAAALIQVGEPSIRRCLSQGKAYGFKTPGGQYRICRTSLLLAHEPQDVTWSSSDSTK